MGIRYKIKNDRYTHRINSKAVTITILEYSNCKKQTSGTSGAGANIQGDMTVVHSLTRANPGMINQPYLQLHLQ